MLDRARNAIIFAAVVSVALFYFVILYVLLALCQMVPCRTFRKKFVACCKHAGFHLAVSLLGYWFPNPVYIRYNKSILKHKRTITISNHCSDYDWIFLLLIFHEFGILDSRILLKKSLGSVPILGFILKRFGHVCMNRAKSKDIQIIQKSMRAIRHEPKYNVAIYPEGTYLFHKSVNSAQKFAEESKLHVGEKPYIPERVLLPRKTGFSIMTDILGKSYDGVIDVTIMMNPYIYMPSEECTPYELFVQKKRVINQFLLVDYVPRTRITEEFLIQSFKKKEDRIQTYIKQVKGTVGTEDDFLKTIENIEPTKPNDVTKTLFIYSKYRTAIFAFPAALIIFSILRIAGC